MLPVLQKNLHNNRTHDPLCLDRVRLPRVRRFLLRHLHLKSQEKKAQSELPAIDDEKLYLASTGSGFAATSTGHIVTNHHVVEGCAKVTMVHRHEELRLYHVFDDEKNDLALYKGDFKPEYIYKISRQDPELADNILVVGYPGFDGIDYNSTVKVHKGIVSSLSGIGNNLSEFQVDAVLMGGNSGGPIINDYGNVVGVAVAGIDTVIKPHHLAQLFKGKAVSFEQGTVNFGVRGSVLQGLLKSQGIQIEPPHQRKISKDRLRNIINGATYFLKCFKTGARLKAELRGN